MAIGKVDAYATVESPNINFGDIAVNAQKFQTAGLDRVKDMIPKETKKDSVKPQSYDAVNSNIGTVENLAFKLVQEAKDKNYYALEDGDYVTASRADNTVKTINAVKTSLSTKASELSKDMNNISGIDEDRIDLYTTLVSGRGTDGTISENGDMSLWALEQDDLGNVSIGEDGKPIKKKFRDSKGNELSEMSSYYIINQLGSDFIRKQDVDKETEIFAKATGMAETSVENGTVTTKIKQVTEESLKSLDASIMSRLKSDKKYMMDIWYQSNPEKNKEKKKEYSEDDYKEAQKFLKNETRRRFDSSYTQSVDEPNVTNISLGKDDKNNYVSPIASEDIVDYTKGGKKIAERAVGYKLSVNQNDNNIFVGSNKAQLEGVGYDNLSKRFYISYYSKVSENEKTSATSSESRAKTEVKKIYLNGSGANVSLANTIVPKLSFQDENGNLRRYSNTKEIISAIKKADPNGKYFGGKKVAAKKQINKQTTVKGGNIRQ